MAILFAPLIKLMLNQPPVESGLQQELYARALSVESFMPERRNQGILTMKDRNILLESEPEEYPHYFRGRTREKLKQGLADLAFTAENLEDEDIAAVFKTLSNPALEEETSYTKESFTRETVVNALSLFIQAVDLVGNGEDTDLENVIRDAIFEAYHRNHPRQVIGSVDVEVKASPRQEAHDRAYRKRRDGDLLSPSEMRAFIDADQPADKETDESSSTQKRSRPALPTEPEVNKYIIDNLGEIEPGLDLTDFQPEAPDRDSYALCTDQDEETVLIEWISHRLMTHDVEHFYQLIKHCGGPEQLRGILIAPPGGDAEAKSDLVESGFEFRELELGPYGVIKGINHPTNS